MASVRSWLGIGCAGLALFSVGLAIVAWITFGEELRALLSDPSTPEERDRVAAEILGLESLPDGYRSLTTLPGAVMTTRDMQAVMLRMVVLTDEEDGLGTSGLVFIESRQMRGDRRALAGFFEGRGPSPEIITRLGLSIDFDGSDEQGRGLHEHRDTELDWFLRQGRLRYVGSEWEGLVTVLRPVCPEGDRDRLVVAYGPEETSDPTLLGARIGAMRLCGTS